MTYQELAAEVVALKAKLMEARLYKSAQLMDKVVDQVGWEVAEKDRKSRVAESICNYCGHLLNSAACQRQHP